jgi:predicted nuclease with TOPRIM domain
VSERNRSRGAELRAERVRWRGRSRNVSQASRSMNERLRKMRDQGSNLDNRLRRHADDSERWHTAWDDPAMTGG